VSVGVVSVDLDGGKVVGVSVGGSGGGSEGVGSLFEARY
jgi:hypothetical protein